MTPSDGSPAIDLRGLVKVHGTGDDAVRAVDGLDLQVARGAIFGLLGPNGAGKTTTVEICEGLQEATSGTVRILGRSFGEDDGALRQRIGVTLQDTRFFDKQTVREILTLFASFYDNPRPVDEVIGLVTLESKAGARYSTLSGGQRQRVAVACALTGRPELLFLDEPTTGLDPQARRQLWDVVRGFRDGGGTVLLTTHYMDEAAALCDRITIIDRGRAIAEGSPDELIASLGAGHIVELHAAGIESLDRAAIAALPDVHSVTLDAGRATLTADGIHRALPAVLQATHAAGVELADLTLRTTTLEDVFVSLTGRQLRDETEAEA